MESERYQWEQQTREPWGQNLQPAEAPDTNDNATYKKPGFAREQTSHVTDKKSLRW